MYRLYLLGHSHVDVVWLWPIEETKLIVKKLFRHILNLMEKYSYFTYAQSTTLYYKWIAEDRDIMDRLREFIRRGQWEVVGGSWVECDCNMLSGESLIRQFLYGLKLLKRMFNINVRVAWFPDSFGFPATIPQILRDCGIKYLVIQKLNWNDTVLHPYNIFWWEGIDGSRVLTYQTVGGYGDDPRDTSKLKTLIRTLNLRQGLNEILILYGIGDHGNGPTEDMVKYTMDLPRKLSNLGVCEVKHVKCEEYMEYMEEKYGEKLPVFKGELYLQFHRGTYTSQVKIKELIKECEYLIEVLEKILVASYLIKRLTYNRHKLEKLWHTILTAHFHDIISGSLSKTPYTQFKRILREHTVKLKGEIEYHLKELLKHITSKSHDKLNSEYTILIFNPTPRDREVYVATPSLHSDRVNHLAKVRVHGLSLKLIPTSMLKSVNVKSNLKVHSRGNHIVLENNRVRLVIDRVSGRVVSIYSKDYGCEYLSGRGLRFEIYDDKPVLGRVTAGTIEKIYDYIFDCWETFFLQQISGVKYYEFTKPVRVEVVEQNPLRATVLVEYSYTSSEGDSVNIKHYLRLYNSEEWIEGIIDIDWRCKHKLLKLCLDLNYWIEEVTVGQPYGHTVRRNPASPYSTLFDRAKWEAVFNRWIDCSNGVVGLALICNTRFGYDLVNKTIRLSLLRAPKFPPEWGTPWTRDNLEKQDIAEERKHRIKYYIYLHRGNWIEGKVPTVAEDLIVKPYIITVKKNISPMDLTLLKIEPKILSIPAIKLCEEDESIVVRIVNYYNSYINGKLRIELDNVKIVKAVASNILEECKEKLKHNSREVEVTLKPYEVKTVKLYIDFK